MKAGVVTGASSGIGRGIALDLAEAGHTVLGCGRSVERLASVEQEGMGLPGRLVAHQCDVTVEEDVIAAIARVDDEFSGLDFIVNCAGVLTHAPIHELSNEEWEHVGVTNVTSVFWACKHAIRSMKRRGVGGSIVNMGSVLSLCSDPGFVSYTASKHAVLGLTRAIAVDSQYVRAGIRANCVCPGDVDTPMMQNYFRDQDDPDAYRAGMEEDYPAGRMVQAEEVAKLVTFLISDAAPIMSGAALVLDGGRLETY